MNGKNVVLAPQDQIEQYGETARRFFIEVLSFNFYECVLTDESHLSDFASCGMPDELADRTAGLTELYAAWDGWVLGELRTRYGLEYETTSLPLLTVFRDLEQLWNRRQQ